MNQYLKHHPLLSHLNLEGWRFCMVCKEGFNTERELQRHVSRNWPRCGTMKESYMARSGKAVIAETNTTWEYGKLKLTLTRKSDSSRREDDRLSVTGKDGDVVWSGTVAGFTEFSASIGGLFEAVNQSLFGPRAEGGSCSCPIQHAIDCGK